MSKIWNSGPLECANSACKRSLKEVNPIYIIKNDDAAYCSQACRATKTNETVTSRPAKVEPLEPLEPKAPKAKSNLDKIVEPAMMPPKGKKPMQADARPTPPAIRAPRASAPQLEAKIHLTGKQPPKFQSGSIRERVWAMIKEGMTVGALYGQCEKAGLDGKSNLAKFISVYGCVEVK